MVNNFVYLLHFIQKHDIDSSQLLKQNLFHLSVKKLRLLTQIYFILQ